MFELFLASDNIPFSVALVMLIGIALLEGITVLMGAGFSQFLESLLPEIDLPDGDLDIDVEGDIDADIEIDTPSIMTRFFGWIKIKGVPMIVVLVVFLTIFSLSGFILQGTVKAVLNFYLPWYLASLPAVMVTLPCVRYTSLLLANVVIKDETQVVSTKTFVGKIAVISLGCARKGHPAEAKITDKYGQTHYIRVEPAEDNEEFEQSSKVLLVEKKGHIFTVISNPNIKLTD